MPILRAFFLLEAKGLLRLKANMGPDSTWATVDTLIANIYVKKISWCMFNIILEGDPNIVLTRFSDYLLPMMASILF